MEQNLPVIAKKFCNVLRLGNFMLRKGISKAKLLADLNMKYMMMKHGKIAGKSASYNLMFRHSAPAARRSHRDEPQLSSVVPLDELEFGCSHSPAYPSPCLPFHLSRRKRSFHLPPQHSDGDVLAEASEVANRAASSPALPGRGSSSTVRQLRITETPLPSRDLEEDAQVDEAAEKFITKFYRELRQQISMAS